MLEDVSNRDRVVLWISLLAISVLFYMQWFHFDDLVNNEPPFEVLYGLLALTLIPLGIATIAILVRAGCSEGAPTPKKRLLVAAILLWAGTLTAVWILPAVLLGLIPEPSIVLPLMEALMTVIVFGVAPSLLILPIWAIVSFLRRDS